MKNLWFGIIGNMGPEADILFQDIIRKETIKYGAKKDQDHINMIVIKNSDIPDRSEAINEGGLSPVPELLKSIKMLEKFKVKFAVMPCNTAHYYKDTLQKETSIILMDMIEATINHINQKKHKTVVGVLMTNGSYNSGIYEKYLKNNNVNYKRLDIIEQEKYVHSAIYGEKTNKNCETGQNIREKDGIKSGIYKRNIERLSKAIDIFKDKNVDTIILGCTEISIVENDLSKKHPDIHFINPMKIIAKKVVSLHMGV